MTPTLAELRHDIDHFHLPTSGMANRNSWGEWHYFNVISPDANRWAFVSFIVGGDVTGDQWGGQVLVTLHERGRVPRRFSRKIAKERVRFSTRDADLTIGNDSVRVLPDGRYAVRADVREEGVGTALTLDLVVSPAPRVDFPGATLVSGDFTSGYAVPALRADATGSLCVARVCEQFDGAQAYHDHNWGGWRGVTWEWGSARAGEYTLLYGRVTPEDSAGATGSATGSATAGGNAPLFVYVTDAQGFLALFRPRVIRYDDARAVRTATGILKVPATAELIDVRGTDTLRLTLTVDDAVVTDTRIGLVERGDSESARGLRRPWFVQMAGEAQLAGRVRGRVLSGRGRGFFETYR
jgi:hypothetical protein